jgi:hypothetical protein
MRMHVLAAVDHDGFDFLRMLVYNIFRAPDGGGVSMLTRVSGVYVESRLH